MSTRQQSRRIRIHLRETEQDKKRGTYESSRRILGCRVLAKVQAEVLFGIASCLGGSSGAGTPMSIPASKYSTSCHVPHPSREGPTVLQVVVFELICIAANLTSNPQSVHLKRASRLHQQPLIHLSVSLAAFTFVVKDQKKNRLTKTSTRLMHTERLTTRNGSYDSSETCSCRLPGSIASPRHHFV